MSVLTSLQQLTAATSGLAPSETVAAPFF
jgi:hypothetical protein